MNITVRPATPNDFEAIANLNHEALGYDFSPLETRRRLSELLHKPSHLIVVAEADGEVIGYLHACDFDLIYTSPLKQVVGVAVRERQRHRGAGRLMLQAAEEWARRTGARGVRITSDEQRSAAHAFYAACGYTRRAQRFAVEKAV